MLLVGTANVVVVVPLDVGNFAISPGAVGKLRVVIVFPNPAVVAVPFILQEAPTAE